MSRTQPAAAGLGGLERSKSATSSYHDPEFVPEVHLSPITSRASRVSRHDADAEAQVGEGHDISDADTRSTRVAPAGEKDYIEVTWDGPRDRANPLNMRAWRKW